VGIARGCGRRAAALLTDMSEPLGNAIGNALEVEQAIEILKGGGPGDLRDLSLVLAGELLLLSGRAGDSSAGCKLAKDALDSGAAIGKLEQMIRAQGGDTRVITDSTVLPRSSRVQTITAPRAGFITRIDPQAVGHAVALLGGGRAKKGDVIDPAVGVVLRAKVGDRVERGEPLAFLHARGSRGMPEAVTLTASAYRIGTRAPVRPPSVLGIVR
jgi:thymidine phosphorylase